MGGPIFPYIWLDFVQTIVGVLADGEPHKVQDVRNSVIRVHSITPEQLAMTHADGQSAFVVTVAHVFARLSSRNAAERIKADGEVTYQMTPKGLDVVRRVGLAAIKMSHFDRIIHYDRRDARHYARNRL